MIAANNNALVFFGLFLAGLLFVPLSVSFMVPEADADHYTETVQNAPGSSYVGCEETNSCFLPSTVIIDVGGTVTWENPDNVPHTVTSGTSSNGPDGYFDSNLIMVGDTYTNTFDSAGTYTYFCMIHPWMAGTVTVTAGGSGTTSLSGTILRSDGTAYQTTKWQADEALTESGLNWTIFRPSLIFGDPCGEGRPEFCTQVRDDMLSMPFPAPLFYNGLLPFNSGLFSMSPIHVKNVAEFFVKSINSKICEKNIFDLGGPEVLTWKEIIHKIALASGKRTWKIPAPVVVIKIAASILDRFKWFPVTRDQLTMLMESNTVSANYFDDFSINPKNFNLENLEYLK